MLIDGCHEGKHTPRLSEVKCPKCGEWVDVFIHMGGRPGQTGTLAADEKCTCGYVLPAGSYESEYEQGYNARNPMHRLSAAQGKDCVLLIPVVK